MFCIRYLKCKLEFHLHFNFFFSYKNMDAITEAKMKTYKNMTIYICLIITLRIGY